MAGKVPEMHALRSHRFPVLPRSLTGLRVFAVSKKAVTVASHPLDPLSASEIADVADACRSYAQEHGHAPIRFNTIGLKVSYHIDKNTFPCRKAEIKTPSCCPCEEYVYRRSRISPSMLLRDAAPTSSIDFSHVSR